jgi:hypothetical protein
MSHYISLRMQWVISVNRLADHFVDTCQVTSAFSEDETAMIAWTYRRQVGQSTYDGLTKRCTK